MTTSLPFTPTAFVPTAEALNRDCVCNTLKQQRLRTNLESDPSLWGLLDTITHTRPHLFSDTVVFISDKTERQIGDAVAAIERIAALPNYQAMALSHAPSMAQSTWGPLGACMGYDFHISSNAAQLIEVNTNAGGLMLNAALASAHKACGDSLNGSRAFNGDAFYQLLFDMFSAEWHLQRGDASWRNVLIVDKDPDAQYLAPEFQIFRQFFQNHGIDAHIADPRELQWQNSQLLYHNRPVEMVYNRLTDFYLEEQGATALRQACQAGAVVVTPHPRAHALLADKRNLIALSQDKRLQSWGVSVEDRKLLQMSVPETQIVTLENADDLWAQRRQLFFKPVAGYGAKAAYRGDKLTRRVWGDILKGDFVAQTLVTPALRSCEIKGVRTDLKYDIRAYTYAGQVQLLAARLYAGQTTNFRTPGGGFAPVRVVTESG